MIDGYPAQSTAREGGQTTSLQHWLVVAIQLALLALLYGQTHAFDYVYYDDGEYVAENPAVLAGLTMGSIRWAFTTFYLGNWDPLTWLSHMLDVSLFGPDPGWAHLHNVALHGVNSLLVYALLLKLSGSWWKSFVLSVIFLVHPLHVESVAWIAERKDLLCALFFLLGLLVYDSYRNTKSTLKYCGVLLSFVLALLSKPMAVTFPVVLLILDFFVYRTSFQRGTGKNSREDFDFLRALMEKLPLFALSAAASVVAVFAQDEAGAVTSVGDYPLTARCVTVVIGYVTYLRQSLLPVKLAAFYPTNLSPSLSDAYIPFGILLVLAVMVATLARKLPLLAAGMCWFAITLVPVIGIVTIGGHAHADRFMYLPSVGLLIACICLLPARESSRFQFANILVFLFIGYLSVLCFWQVGYWTNGHVLFSRVVDVVGPNYKAHIHLGHDYLRRGMLEKAKEESQAALKLRPNMPSPYITLGEVALREQDYAAAEQYYRIALTTENPPVAGILHNLGIAMAEQGNIAAGVEALEDSVKIDPTLERTRELVEYYKGKLAQTPTP